MAGVQRLRARTVTIASMTRCLPADISRLLSSILVQCVDIQTVWSAGYANEGDLPRQLHEVFIFADTRTLRILQKSDHLHHADVHALVVFDGEQFETAWGTYRISGSLARCGWHQVTPDLAYYDESRRSEHGDDAGTLVRIRRKAVLIWASQG